MIKISPKQGVLLVCGIITAATAVSFAIVATAMWGKGSSTSTPSEPSTVATADEPAATALSAFEPSTAAAELTTQGGEFATDTEQTDETAAIEETGAQEEPHALPQKLSDVLAAGGMSADTLDAYGCEQLITVNSSGTSANISFFEKSDGAWTSNDLLDCAGFVGMEGTVTEMSEQISGTPKGLYPIGEAFYQDEAPQTGLEAFHITADTYWVDDPDSEFYNQRVEGYRENAWNSAEHMADTDGYKYGFVIGYNLECEYNKGSAIFFHIGSLPTHGCVATTEEMVLAYLSALNAGKNPYIFVV